MAINLKKYGAHLFRVATLLFLSVYFTLTLLYVLPANPLRDSLQPEIDATISAYFPQDWNLFAPVPRQADLALLVRPLKQDELKIIKTRGLPNDGWYNLSAPLWIRFQTNRFSAYNRLGRPADQAIAHYLVQPQTQTITLMVKIASAFCKDIGQKQASFVALMISERLSQAWPPQANSGQRTTKLLFVGVYPLDHNVEGMRLYRIGDRYEPLS